MEPEDQSDAESWQGLHWRLDSDGRPTVLSQLGAITTLLLEHERLDRDAKAQGTAKSLRTQIESIAKQVRELEIGTADRVEAAHVLRTYSLLKSPVDLLLDEDHWYTRKRVGMRKYFTRAGIEPGQADRMAQEHVEALRSDRTIREQTAAYVAEVLESQTGVSVSTEDVLRAADNADHGNHREPYGRFMEALKIHRRAKQGRLASPTSYAEVERAQMDKDPVALFSRPASATPRILDLVLRSEAMAAPEGPERTYRDGIRHAIAEVVESFSGEIQEPRKSAFLLREPSLEASAFLLSAASRQIAKRIARGSTDFDPKIKDFALTVYAEEARRLWSVSHAADEAWGRLLKREHDTFQGPPRFFGLSNIDRDLFLDPEPPVYVEGSWIRAVSLATMVLEIFAWDPSRSGVLASLVNDLESDNARTNQSRSILQPIMDTLRTFVERLVKHEVQGEIESARRDWLNSHQGIGSMFPWEEHLPSILVRASDVERESVRLAGCLFVDLMTSFDFLMPNGPASEPNEDVPFDPPPLNTTDDAVNRQSGPAE
jgi:hypothetical protein